LELIFFMETIFADQTVSMSEFKRNPASVLRRSHKRPVAVLSHNKAAFYLIDPQLFQAMLDELASHELHRTALACAPRAPHDKRPAYRAVMERLGKMADSSTPAHANVPAP
jgi:antitoxin StbD